MHVLLLSLHSINTICILHSNVLSDQYYEIENTRVKLECVKQDNITKNQTIIICI